MIEDVHLWGLSERTQEAYVPAIRQLAEHFGKSSDLITLEELRWYFIYLKNVEQCSRSTLFQLSQRPRFQARDSTHLVKVSIIAIDLSNFLSLHLSHQQGIFEINRVGGVKIKGAKIHPALGQLKPRKRQERAKQLPDLLARKSVKLF
jgi:hypothetical protein